MEMSKCSIKLSDLYVVYGDFNGYSPGDEYYSVNFMFYIKKDGKEYCTYYDFDPSLDWWPKCGPDNEENNFSIFIPRGFAEAMENSYEFDGTVEEALALLRKCGITDLRKHEE